jgi:E3 ubiquitin-protein ligase MYCBP2
VSNISFSCGPNGDELSKLQQVDVEARHIGWVRCELPDANTKVIKMELKGPDNTLRIRQVKVLGGFDGERMTIGSHPAMAVMQQKNCEAETLKVFRLLTSLVSLKIIFFPTFLGMLVILLMVEVLGPRPEACDFKSQE